MLDNHPHLAVPAETNLVFPLWRFRVRYGDLRRPENRRRVAEWIFLTEGYGGQRIRAGRDPREAIERAVAAPPTLGAILATCFEMYAEMHGKVRWGDKRPGYAGHIETMFALFPDAHFIHLVRDPRAAVASQLPLGWATQEDALAHSIANWETAVARVDAYARRLRPDQLLDVRYEDLVRDPHTELERICAFAGLRGGDAVAHMVSADRRGTFREGWHDRLNDPVSTAPITSWRERLTPGAVNPRSPASTSPPERRWTGRPTTRDRGVSCVSPAPLPRAAAVRRPGLHRRAGPRRHQRPAGTPRSSGPQQIHAQQAWATSTGAGAVIAVVDTGVDLTHPDLAGQLVAGATFIGCNPSCGNGDWKGPDGIGQAEDAHGTHVSGIAAAADEQRRRHRRRRTGRQDHAGQGARGRQR